jgi:hypothetical protein
MGYLQSLDYIVLLERELGALHRKPQVVLARVSVFLIYIQGSRLRVFIRQIYVIDSARDAWVFA